MTLFIIGNGFDLNHDYETGYNSFCKYLQNNSYMIGSIDLTLLFPETNSDLWKDFEYYLEFIDLIEITDFIVGSLTDELNEKEWDREYSRNAALQEDFEMIPEQLLQALCKALNDFLVEETNKKTVTPKSYFKKIFNGRSKFITFNYTKTLEKIYDINEKNIKHIHGEIYQQLWLKDDLCNEVYEDPIIIFGHGNIKKNKYKEIKPEDINPLNPNLGLINVNEKLQKNYQLEAFKSFIENDEITEIQIIGHGLGPVDAPYFKMLNKMISKDVCINYWKTEKDNEEEIIMKLKKLFPKHTIKMINYPPAPVIKSV